MRRVIVAPESPPLDGPVVFLAGPTWCTPGTAPWHERALELLGRLDPALHVANPRRPLETEHDFDEAAYAEQVDWETAWLRRAGATGAVLFWLAREDHHRCHRPHAQTTRFELGEWKEHARAGARLVLGIEDGFSGARYVRRRFAQECPTVPILDTLEATCRAAVACARAGAARR